MVLKYLTLRFLQLFKCYALRLCYLKCFVHKENNLTFKMTPCCLFWEQSDRIFLYLTWAIKYFSFKKQAVVISLQRNSG